MNPLAIHLYRAMLTTNDKWTQILLEQPKHEGEGSQWYPAMTTTSITKQTDTLDKNGFDIVEWDQELYDTTMHDIKQNYKPHRNHEPNGTAH